GGLTGTATGVARRLPKSKQRLERGEHARSARELCHDLLLRSGAHCVVDRALAFVELTVKDGLGARRQLGSDFALEAAQDEGPHFGAQPRGRARVACGDLPFVARLERA